MLDKENKRQLKRILKLLNKAGVAHIKLEIEEEKSIIAVAGKKHSFMSVIIHKAIQDSLLKIDGNTISLTLLGKSLLKRLLNPDMPFTAQHADLVNSSIKVESIVSPILKNNNECALSRLYFRKAKNGKGWLDHDEYQAGERLRSDFEKAQLSPNISARWGATMSGSNRAADGATDISDFALDAKVRMEKAIGALGPELSGVTLDVCCFLKGLEVVEREKSWPPRSAKLLLKTALSILVRHYGIKSDTKNRPNRFWGADNYRPEMFL